MFLMMQVYLLLIFLFSVLMIFGMMVKKMKKFLGQREMSGGFECGFDGKKISRMPFSMRFFLMLMLFLIFDLEMIWILQFPFLKKSNSFLFFLGLKMFLFVMFMGTMEELRRGFLTWVYAKMFMNSKFS